MSDRQLDPEIAAILGANTNQLPTFDRCHLPALRRQQMLGMKSLSLSDQVIRRDFEVPGPPGAPTVMLRAHVPRGLAGPAPCMYSMHGGGYVMGHRGMDDLRFDHWCPQLGFIGVSVEYRLAPETPFPGPLEDCYAGLRWLFDHSDELGIDSSRIGISGTSAGGGLAASLALLARDRGQVRIAFQLLAYPMIDDRQHTESSKWEVPVWSAQNNEFGWQSYLGELYGGPDVPSLAAAARTTDLTGLPPTMIFVGGADRFHDEDITYAMRLAHADVSTELHVYPGAPHGFDRSAPDTEIARRCRHSSQAWLSRAFAVEKRRTD
jgi:acetyl esterase/lipase